MRSGRMSAGATKRPALLRRRPRQVDAGPERSALSLSHPFWQDIIDGVAAMVASPPGAHERAITVTSHSFVVQPSREICLALSISSAHRLIRTPRGCGCHRPAFLSAPGCGDRRDGAGPLPDTRRRGRGRRRPGGAACLAAGAALAVVGLACVYEKLGARRARAARAGESGCAGRGVADIAFGVV